MFLNQKHFVIHAKNKPCQQINDSKNSDSNTNDINHQVVDFLQKTYPKQKYLPIIFKILESHNLIDENLFFTDFPNIHMADLCSFVNNSFAKPTSTDAKFIKFCKFLHAKGIRFPKISIKNPVAQKYLCN